MDFAQGVLDADDEHVFGEPAFAARLPAGDTQCMALLAEQRVAAVAGAEALDREFLGKVHDEAPLGIEITDRVQAADEGAVPADAFERAAAHARHQLHVEHDIGAVGDFDAAAGERRIERTHAIGDDVQRPALHASGEERVHLPVCCIGRQPVIVRTGIVLAAGADEGDMLDPGDVLGIRAVEYAAGEVFLVEWVEFLRCDQLPFEHVEFRIAAVAPVDRIGTRELGNVIHPGRHCAVHGSQIVHVLWGGSHGNSFDAGDDWVAEE